MKFKQKYNIGKALSLAGLMMLANACQKEYDVVIDWDWRDNLGFAPPKEMIKNETDKKHVKTVFINLVSDKANGHTPYAFHVARDTLQTRLDIAPGKVRGMGTIYINPEPGADNRPNHEMGQDPGIAWYDKLWFEENGWGIKPWVPPRGKQIISFNNQT